MDTPLDALIANELAKVDLLRAKIKECEQRIAMLRSMQSGDDDLDAALARRVVVRAATDTPGGDAGGDAQVAPAAQLSNGTGAQNRPFPKKALSASTVAMLRFAGTEDKSTDQFLGFASQNEIGKSRQGMRAFLHQYKTTYKLLSSDRDGYFRLSDLGVAYLASIDTTKNGATTSKNGEATSAG